MAAHTVAGLSARSAGTDDLRRARARSGWSQATSTRVGALSLAPGGACVAARCVRIRHEGKADYEAIRSVNENAFGRLTEAELVEAIRVTDRFLPQLSLVALV